MELEDFASEPDSLQIIINQNSGLVTPMIISFDWRNINRFDVPSHVLAGFRRRMNHPVFAEIMIEDVFGKEMGEDGTRIARMGNGDYRYFNAEQQMDMGRYGRLLIKLGTDFALTKQVRSTIVPSV